jgi:D-amino-acid dehydrogenase
LCIAQIDGSRQSPIATPHYSRKIIVDDISSNGYDSAMKIAILGAGIAGVTSAYVLASRGHEVTIIEQEDGAALQTSYSNGAQLSYSHAEPWANPGALKKALGWMFRSDAPLVLRPRADLAMLRWLAMFLGNCTPARTRLNTERMLRIALYSRDKLAEIRTDTDIDFDFKQCGILHIFSSEKDFNAAIAQSEYQESLGCKEHVLTKAQCLDKEPALRQSRKPIVGGIFADMDEVGDIHLFTQRLAAYCEGSLNVSIEYNTRILHLEQEGSKLSRVHTSNGDIEADAFVMCLGSHSPKLLNPLGIRLPIYPMKGYSMTLPAWDGAPELSVTDDEKKVVFSRIGDRVRAAGTAEFAGYDESVRDERIEQMLGSMRELFPDAPTGDREEWACLRPQTPDGPPMVGRTPLTNLFLNTGHGTLGWTQGAGSAYLLADVMEGKPPEISMHGLDMSRYRK